MAVLIAFFVGIGLFTTFYTIQEKPEDRVSINVGAAPGNTLEFSIKPLSEFKNSHVVKQMYDYSCGSAALATVLNFEHGEDFDEKRVIQGLLQHGDKEKIESRRAFSLLDMKRFIGVLGYQGAGYRAEIEDLLTLKQPGIMPLEMAGYSHFAVFRGICDNHVFLADPSLGNISYELKEFEKMWTEKIIFIINHKHSEKIKWHALKLSDRDLRYVDYDFSRKFIFGEKPSFAISVEKELLEQGGGHFYRSK